jgi:hypothetical protein
VSNGAAPHAARGYPAMLGSTPHLSRSLIILSRTAPTRWIPLDSSGLARTQVAGVSAGQRPYRQVIELRPQQDSNLRTRLRRPLLYPLSYGGWRQAGQRVWRARPQQEYQQ